MVTHFSVLELHVKTLGHVYGAFALHVLGMDRICNATQSLKVILLRSSKVGNLSICLCIYDLVYSTCSLKQMLPTVNHLSIIYIHCSDFHVITFRIMKHAQKIALVMCPMTGEAKLSP